MAVRATRPETAGVVEGPPLTDSSVASSRALSSALSQSDRLVAFSFSALMAARLALALTRQLHTGVLHTSFTTGPARARHTGVR